MPNPMTRRRINATHPAKRQLTGPMHIDGTVSLISRKGPPRVQIWHKGKWITHSLHTTYASAFDTQTKLMRLTKRQRVAALKTSMRGPI